MLIRKSKNVMSTGAESFIKNYEVDCTSHKIFIEFPVTDYLKLKEKQTGLEIAPLLKKRASRLTFDFYDHTIDEVFEVNGSQHSSFNSFFHKDIGNFDRQQSNDFLKTTICDFYKTKITFINVKG